MKNFIKVMAVVGVGVAGAVIIGKKVFGFDCRECPICAPGDKQELIDTQDLNEDELQ